MTYEQALKKTGCATGYQLAKFFGLTEPAIKRWRDKNQIPPLRAYQIDELLQKKKNGRKSGSKKGVLVK